MDACKTMVFIGEQDAPQFIETIWHGAHWWLVASWLQHLSTGHRIPERIIQLDGKVLRYQEVTGQPFRFSAVNSIPMSVFDGELQSEYVTAVHPAALAHTHGPKSIH